MVILVRLGEFPLHYALALRTMTDYYRIANEEEGHAMTILLEEYEADTEWTETCFLGAARENIDYFQTFVEEALLDAPSTKVFSKLLKQAMFSELTETWQRLDKAAFTKHILPIWRDLSFSSPYSKATETVLIKSCFAQNFTLNFKHKHTPSTTNRCRLCKAEPETIEHLYLRCNAVDTQRNVLKEALGGKELSLRNILGTFS